MRDGYTNGLVSYGGNRRIFRPQGETSRLYAAEGISRTSLKTCRTPERAFIPIHSKTLAWKDWPRMQTVVGRLPVGSRFPRFLEDSKEM